MLYIPWTSILFKSTITHLRLQSPIPPNSTLDKILAALACMPSLKSHSLSSVLPPSSQGSGRTVHLPHLETLATSGEYGFAAWRKQLRAPEIVPDDPSNTDVVLNLHPSRIHPFKLIFQDFLTLLPLSNVYTLYLASGASFGSCWKLLSDLMPNIRELEVSSDRKDDQKGLNLLVVRLPRPNSPALPPLFPCLKILLLSGMTWYYNPYDDASLMLLQRMIEELVLKNAINFHKASLELVQGVVWKLTCGMNDGRWEGFGQHKEEELWGR